MKTMVAGSMCLLIGLPSLAVEWDSRHFSFGQHTENGQRIGRFHAKVSASAQCQGFLTGCTVAAGWTVKIPGESDHYKSESNYGFSLTSSSSESTRRTVNSYDSMACCEEKTAEFQYTAAAKDGVGSVTGYGFGITLQGSEIQWTGNHFFTILKEDCVP